MAQEKETQQTKSEPAKSSKATAENIDQVKVFAFLAYFGILFFLPLVTNPDSQFGKFHANQGLLLFISGIAINIVGSFIPFLGWFIILPLGWIFLIVLFILGIINALNGKMNRLPLIGQFDIIK